MTPFERAMKIHEDRYGAMAADGRHWRRTAFGLFCLLALSVVGMGTMALRSRVTPYVVQVDEHGYEVLIGPAEEASPADDRIVKAPVQQPRPGNQNLRPEPADDRFERDVDDPKHHGVRQSLGTPHDKTSKLVPENK